MWRWATATAPIWPTACSSPCARWPTSSTGVRKASPGTYAMLENKLSWAPGSIDTILAGGEPKETVVETSPPHPQRPVRAIRTAPDQRQRPLACLHRGAVAGATPPHHRPPPKTPRQLGRLGRRPRPARRLARTGLAAPWTPGHCPTPECEMPLAEIPKDGEHTSQSFERPVCRLRRDLVLRPGQADQHGGA